MNTDRFSTSASFFRALERTAASVSNQIVNVCSFELKLAIRNGISPNRMCVIHNGVHDIPSEDRADPTVQPPKIVMVARITGQKDHTTLLHALSGLLTDEWQLELIGEGPLESSVKQQVNDYGLSSRVTFAGYCEGDRVAQHLTTAQIFTLISNFEAFPRSILEAMRAGLPVVATDVGGVSESVHHGVNGFVIPKKNVISLREHLALLIRDAGRRKSMGDAGRRMYSSDFTFDALYERTINLYARVLSEAAASPHAPPL